MHEVEILMNNNSELPPVAMFGFTLQSSAQALTKRNLNQLLSQNNRLEVVEPARNILTL